eukprot:GILJ01000695.1.p1 GENE.GILJ01000695.1~~GILJ01000695.1.p1  ORF type:complete len:192 (+),score=34.94 GILJ01000695.1:41-577(+)
MASKRSSIPPEQLAEIQELTTFTPRELRLLHKRFKRLDTDRSGELEPEEFFDVPELAQNPLVKRVIGIFDRNHDGKVSFVEFVQGLALLQSTSDSQKKLRFAFSVYDIDGDGFISNGELFQVMKMMVGTNLTEQQLQQLVDRAILQADEDKDGKISFEEFSKMVDGIDVAEKLTIKLT